VNSTDGANSINPESGTCIHRNSICGIRKFAAHEYGAIASNCTDIIRCWYWGFDPDFVTFSCMTEIHKIVLHSG
jgi:hypothetical protein